MRTYGLMAAVLGIIPWSPAACQSAEPAADVTVYVNGTSLPPRCEDLAARAITNQIFARIGVSTAWIDGKPMNTDAGASALVISARYVVEPTLNIGPGTLAYMSPFAGRATPITVLYERIRRVAGILPRDRERVLAHVLAHEIGHALKGTNGHSSTGLLKDRWDKRDYLAMEEKPLEFTSVDVDLIRQGLQRLKARTGYQARGIHSP